MTLIVDIGAHTGEDTGFYLAKGFDVVAVEANPDMAKALSKRFTAKEADGKLRIVDRAISDEKEVRFFVNEDKPDWSSVVEKAGARHGTHFHEIVVPGITMAELFAQYGVPYFCKIDIEGGDIFCLRQLAKCEGRPDYVSFEAELGNPALLAEQISLIGAMGYTRFQIVNQRNNKHTRPPNPAREGGYVDARFDGHCSALFGKELDPDGWFDFARLQRRIDHLNRWNVQLGSYNHASPTLLDKARAAANLVLGLPIGWYDIHATGARSS